MSRSTLTTARPTAIQSFASRLLFQTLGEDPVNRTAEEYAAIKARIPNLKTVHFLVNDLLERLARTEEFARREFCRFRAGDTIIRFESYPTSVSIETIRQALIVYGWRDAAKRAR